MSNQAEEQAQKAIKQGNLALLNEPLAQRLLAAPIAARLAYVWHDGTPRVVPTWSYWTGTELVLCGPMKAPKMKVLTNGTPVAVTVDETWPIRSLTIRGSVSVEVHEGGIPEYPQLVQKYLGILAPGWLEMYKTLFPQTARIAIKPEWVGLLDVGSGAYLPSAMVTAMGAG